MKRDTIACARAIETEADGKAPHAVRLWKAGLNETDKGPANFTPRSAQLVMAAYAKRGNPITFDYEHETMVPLKDRGNTPMKGVASAPRSVLELRRDASGQPELWATDIGWTDEARRQIESGERQQISPVSHFDKATREILEIVNVALCIEGATHHGTLLASVAKGTGIAMEELQQKICEATMAGDWETVEALTAQAKAMGGGDLGAMAAAPPLPKPAAPPMAASRTYAPEAFTRGLAELREATKDTRVVAVEMLIAMSRDAFDPADEKYHLAMANPAATKEYIASVKRKIEAGTLAASRTVETGAKPAKEGKPGAVETFGLTEIEMGTASRSGVSFEAFSKSKARASKKGGK